METETSDITEVAVSELTELMRELRSIERLADAELNAFFKSGEAEHIEKNKALLRVLGQKMGEFNKSHAAFLEKKAQVLVYRDHMTKIPYRICAKS